MGLQVGEKTFWKILGRKVSRLNFATHLIADFSAQLVDSY